MITYDNLFITTTLVITMLGEVLLGGNKMIGNKSDSHNKIIDQ